MSAYRIGTKYGSRKTLYNGVLYMSAKEARYAQELDLRVKAKNINSWEGQTPILLKVNDRKICKYILDFKITHNDGSEEYVEIKGFETTVWRLKKKLFEATFLLKNPSVKYSIIK